MRLLSVSSKSAAEPDRSICPQRIAASAGQTAPHAGFFCVCGCVRYTLTSFKFNVSIKRRSKREGLEPRNKGKCGEESSLKLQNEFFFSFFFFDTAHPCQTVAMATVERGEVCGIDKSATRDEGVDRSFWRSLTPTAVTSRKLMPSYADGVRRLAASEPILSGRAI